ncbi:hypothetical protein [Nitrosomonas halophila]|jgi:hypothetical protein|uniref:Uncharacterized protein n=1 Tax=Nitrosomonas halophila TaxID=44576 RepID=A0A1H3NEL5_9PROT|nr:hypothetical protein [Nitrosomonas halophila]SDY87214.1 hypothetical protein SAMN05421881_10726 [Nitrosomonas halophila]
MAIRRGLKVEKIIGGWMLASMVIAVKHSYSASVVCADPIRHGYKAQLTTFPLKIKPVARKTWQTC